MPREYLTSLDAVRQRPHRDAVGGVESTEAVGDPDEDSTEATTHASAAGGTLVGAAVAGPVGAVVGGVLGAAAGAVGSPDEDDPAAERDRAIRAMSVEGGDRHEDRDER